RRRSPPAALRTPATPCAPGCRSSVSWGCERLTTSVTGKLPAGRAGPRLAWTRPAPACSAPACSAPACPAPACPVPACPARAAPLRPAQAYPARTRPDPGPSRGYLPISSSAWKILASNFVFRVAMRQGKGDALRPQERCRRPGTGHRRHGCGRRHGRRHRAQAMRVQAYGEGGTGAGGCLSSPAPGHPHADPGHRGARQGFLRSTGMALRPDDLRARTLYPSAWLLDNGMHSRDLASDRMTRAVPGFFMRADAPADLRAIAEVVQRYVRPGAVISGVKIGRAHV